jgi:hypothetical protein
MAVPSDKPGQKVPGEKGTGAEDAGIVLTPEQKKSRSHRNIAIGLMVGFFVLLIYVVTIAKLGPGVLTHPAE